MGNELKIYVSATKQNDGKTFTALGILNLMREVFPRVGYIKPVGQLVKSAGKHRMIQDANLITNVFGMGDHFYNLSPVAVPRGFTEKYIQAGSVGVLEAKINHAYKTASRGKDVMVIEGTGHAGVGSVFDLSNAAVARLLGSPVIMVTGGGIGHPIDDIMLNKTLFDHYGVPVIGVIINKVLPDKYDKVNKFVRLGLQRKGIKVLGVIPYKPLLSDPTINQLIEDLNGELICGLNKLDRIISRIIVGTLHTPFSADQEIEDILYIIPGSRDDLILSAIACFYDQTLNHRVQGIIITEGIHPHRTVLNFLRNIDIPVLLVKDDTFGVVEKISNLLIKIRPEDKEKINTAKALIKEHVDITELIDCMKRAVIP